MTSQNPQSHIYDPKTLAVMDQAFAAIWNVLRADDPFRDYANDGELRIAIGHKLIKSASTPHRTQSASVRSLRRAVFSRCPSQQAYGGRAEGGSCR